MPGKLLEVRDINVDFAGVKALQDVSFDLDEGNRIAVIGPNGAGKSTLVNCITGSLSPRSGSVRLNGQPAPRRQPHRLVRFGVARTFQHLEIFGGMTVRENLVVGADWSRHRSVGLRRPQRRPAPSVDELLNHFGLRDVADVQASLLPYGVRKMVELARAFAVGPRLLLLDEPAAGLDSREKHQIVDLMNTMLERYPAALLLIEHDMPTVRALCSEDVVVLDAGRMIAHGSFAAVAGDPVVIAAYLGDAPSHFGERAAQVDAGATAVGPPKGES